MNVRKTLAEEKRIDELMLKLRDLGATEIRKERNEHGAVEVTFSSPYCDPGKDGWGVGDDFADALESACESAAYLKRSAKKRGVLSDLCGTCTHGPLCDIHAAAHIVPDVGVVKCGAFASLAALAEAQR